MVSLISHGASGRRLAAAAGSCSSKRRGAWPACSETSRSLGTSEPAQGARDGERGSQLISPVIGSPRGRSGSTSGGYPRETLSTRVVPMS